MNDIFDSTIGPGTKGYPLTQAPRCLSEIGDDAACRVAVTREVDEVEAELARELRRRSATASAGVVVDGDAVSEGEVDGHGEKDALKVRPGGVALDLWCQCPDPPLPWLRDD